MCILIVACTSKVIEPHLVVLGLNICTCKKRDCHFYVWSFPVIWLIFSRRADLVLIEICTFILLSYYLLLSYLPTHNLLSVYSYLTFTFAHQEPSDNQYNSNNKNMNNNNDNRNMCMKASLADDDALSSEASEPHSTPPSSVSSVSDDTVSWGGRSLSCFLHPDTYFP